MDVDKNINSNNNAQLLKEVLQPTETTGKGKGPMSKGSMGKGTLASIAKVFGPIGMMAEAVVDMAEAVVNANEEPIGDSNLTHDVQRDTKSNNSSVIVQDAISSLNWTQNVLAEVKSNIAGGIVQSERLGKASIMARNLSHNLGSHVMYYMQTDLQSNVTPESIRGVCHFLKYLQERQDFIASVSTNIPPYFSPLAFKEAVFDYINPDLKSLRHDRDVPVVNYLLKYIARSENLEHVTEREINKSSLNVLMFDRKNGELHYGNNDPSDLDCIRDKMYLFPSASTQAIMSILENLIRNAAKHENNKILNVYLELWDTQSLLKYIQEDVSLYYREAEDERLLDYLAISYPTQEDGEALDNILNRINYGLLEQYADGYGTMRPTNKGLKEIRTCAAWLRGEMDETKYRECNKTKTLDRLLVPLVFAQKSKVGEQTVIQFIIGLRKFLPLAIIKEDFPAGIDEICDNISKQCEVFIYKWGDEYVDKRFNCAEYTIVANEKIKNRIRPHSYNRIIVCSLDDLKRDDLFEILPMMCLDSDRIAPIFVDEKLYSSQNENTNVTGVCEDNWIDREHIAFKDRCTNEKSQIYHYREHMDRQEHIEALLKILKKGGYKGLEFAESITGHNSTDRLIRHAKLDTRWYYQHLYAMQQKIAIFDERLFGPMMLEENYQKAILYKLKGVFLFYIDSDSKTIYGLAGRNDFSTKQCVQVGTYNVDDNGTISFDVNADIDFKSMYPKFDYLSIHQGILDKIYEQLKLALPEQKNEVTNKLCRVFLKKFKENTESGFQEGLSIHSGRGHHSEEVMPQHVPFIEYSAMSKMVDDCKFTLVNLLDFAKYEKI